MKVAYLVSLVGRRSFLLFFGMGFLLMSLLATLQISSKQALRAYAEDQLGRVPWDVTLYQRDDQDRAPEVRQHLKTNGAVREAETMFFLRTIVPRTTLAYVDGEPLRTPWLSLLTATSPDLVPPDLRPRTAGATLVLIGSKAQMGDAFVGLQNSRRIELRVEKNHRSATAMASQIDRVVRVEATELNRWFMDQTSSPTLVPELGLVIVLPYTAQRVQAFDALSRGVQLAADDHDHDGHDHDHDHAAGLDKKPLGASDEIHSDPGVYFPDVLHVVRLHADKIISGWHLLDSLVRTKAAGDVLRNHAQDVSYRFGMDNNLGALLERMARTADAVGLISLLAAIPLLWVAWIVLGQLTALVILNERRLLGLLRLRGAPGGLLARSLAASIALGAAAGCALGALAGTIVPLRVFAGYWMSWSETWRIQDPRVLVLSVACVLAVTLWSGRRIVRYAASVPPLEAAGRVAASESQVASARFGPIAAGMLALGSAKLLGWGLDLSLPAAVHPWILLADRASDFVAYPFFVFGLTQLLVSRPAFLKALLQPATYVLAGRLQAVALKHVALRPHRAATIVHVMAMTASLCLYPTVMTAVFDDKLERAARIQLGGAVQVTLNAPDFMGAGQAGKGALAGRIAELEAASAPLRERLREIPGVSDVDTLLEGLVDGLYMRGRGFSSTPIFLIGDTERFLRAVTHEAPLGTEDAFAALLRRLDKGEVLASVALAEYLRATLGGSIGIGRAADGSIIQARYGGSVRALPGSPSQTVAQRESFTATRVDYLNHLFSQQTFLVARSDNPALQKLEVLPTRVVVSLQLASNADPSQVLKAISAALLQPPLEVRSIDAEVSRLGSDMYIFLARHNVRIYLVGGLLLALIALTAVATANFRDDRRTLGLLRTRGSSPRDVVRFLSAGLTAPALAGMVVGFLVALAVGYGLTNILWRLREIKSLLNHLVAHLAVSPSTALVGATLLAAVVALLAWFQLWVFQRSARESIHEA